MNRIRTKTALYEHEHLFLCAGIGLSLVFIVLYMYFLSASVVHVVMRKEIDKEIVALGSSLSTLETDFIEAQHAVSEDIASLKGYEHADSKVFIDRGETSLVLSTP